MPHRQQQTGQARRAKNGRIILRRRPEARPDRLDGHIFHGGKRAAGGVQQGEEPAHGHIGVKAHLLHGGADDQAPAGLGGHMDLLGPDHMAQQGRLVGGAS